MKLKFILALLIPLTFGSTVRAIDGVIDGATNDAGLSKTIPETPESKPVDAETSAISKPISPSNISPASGAISSSNSTSTSSPPDLGMSQSIGSNLNAEDTATTMTWPAIPGESLNDIARLFYPKNKIMRQQFVVETLTLNADIEPKLKATNRFDEPTLLQIPTLKSLSQKVGTIKAKRAKAKRQKMQMSYSINKAVSKLPAFLLQEYEALLSKNAFLKAELERLHIRLGILQDKFNSLKLVFDKTMSFPVSTATQNSGVLPNDLTNEPIANAATITSVPETQAALNTPPVKKVFKNLNQANNAMVDAPTSTRAVPEPPKNFAFDWFKYGLLALLSAMFLLSVAAYYIRKRRQRMLDQLSESMPNMDDTITDFGGQWQDTEQEEIESQYVVKHEPEASTKGFLNTEMRNEQAKATSTLEEAKLLMTINRTQDAVSHLKLTIEAQPKVSINHWLYLLEIFRKQNAKEEFEKYAKSLHQTFNVMTPVWYENNATIAEAKIIVSQHLEDFPHIMEKLDAVWPSELARVYLESLMADNRDGERAGFSRSVVDEILLLIALLDARKELE